MNITPVNSGTLTLIVDRQQKKTNDVFNGTYKDVALVVKADDADTYSTVNNSGVQHLTSDEEFPIATVQFNLEADKQYVLYASGGTREFFGYTYTVQSAPAADGVTTLKDVDAGSTVYVKVIPASNYQLTAGGVTTTPSTTVTAVNGIDNFYKFVPTAATTVNAAFENSGN